MRWVIWRKFDLDQVQMGGETAMNELKVLPPSPSSACGRIPPPLQVIFFISQLYWCLIMFCFNHSILRPTLFCPSRQLLQVHSILLPGNCDCHAALLTPTPLHIKRSSWSSVRGPRPGSHHPCLESFHCLQHIETQSFYPLTKPSLLCFVLLGLAWKTCMQMIFLHCCGSTRTHLCFTTSF